MVRCGTGLPGLETAPPWVQFRFSGTPRNTETMNRGALASLAAAALLLAGCVGGDDSGSVKGTGADVALLMMGNSHTSYNNLPGMLEAMVASARAPESVDAVEAPGWMFLDERYHHGPSLALLRGQDWSFVILQAQKYSSSGCCVYSTEEARALVRLARQQNAVPIMFPEWPRRGVDETQRIYDLHVSIAQAEPACVAPIGQAWDLSLQRHPTLALHAADGNHSNPNGAFLAALILSATMTGASPLDAPALEGFGVSAENQALLRAVAADTVADWPPRQWCPDDPYEPPPP